MGLGAWIIPSTVKNLRTFYRCVGEWFVNNPVLIKDFFQYLRGGQFFLVLGLLLLAGSTAITLFWGVEHTQSFPAGRQLFLYLAVGEVLAVILILPALVSHSIITERDRDTLPLLLTTPVGTTKILIGKLISTLGVMILYLIASYPLVSVCIARGGVSPKEVVLWAAGVLYFSFIVACFSIYHAISAKSIFRSMLTAHVSIFVFYLLIAFVFSFMMGMVMGVYSVIIRWFSSGNAIRNVLETTGHILMYGMGTLGFACVTAIPLGFFYFSRKRLDTYEPTEIDPWVYSSHASFQMGQEIKAQSKDKIVKSKWNVEDHGNPFYLREKLGFHSLRPAFSLPSWYLIAVLSHLMFVFTAIYEGRIVAMFTLFFIIQTVPLYAAALFAGERDNHTWDLLITTVFQPRKFYEGKLMGAMYHSGLRAAAFFYPPIVLSVLLVTMFIPTNNQLPLPTFNHLAYFSFILAVQWLFINVLCSYLSLVSQRVNRVMMLTWGIALAYTLIPYLLIPVVAMYQHSVLFYVVKSISPLVMLFMPLGLEESYNLFLTYGVIYLSLSIVLYLWGYSVMRKMHV